MVRVRHKRINPKTLLPIVRESDLDGFDEVDREIDADTGLPKFESGVESKEEREHHLQAVISAAHNAAVGGRVAQISIPTPQAQQSDIQYDKLFSQHFAQPATYIRFSSTVEDCVGVPYCMDQEDEQALQKINSKHASKKGGNECSEDWFEQLMSAFEDTTSVRQPFAAVDHPPVLTLEEMEAAFDESVEDPARQFAKDVYDYWKKRRSEAGDQSLMAKLKTLKMDSGQEADDSDPYVCFRRREVRLARKTRGRDAQVAEKLKKLRKELEDGRYLLAQVKARENLRRDDLALSRKLFEERARLRQVKRESGIQDDDEELLVNQKAPRRRLAELQQPVQRAGQSIRLQPGRPDGLISADANIKRISEELNRREKAIEENINKSMMAHEYWNRNFVDETLDVIYDVRTAEEAFLPNDQRRDGSAFVGVKIEVTQQPTPPASVVADSSSEPDAMEDVQFTGNGMQVAKNADVKTSFDCPGRYRRRRGRGGRMMLDRHNLRTRKKNDLAARSNDRFAFDRDDGDEDSDHSMDLDSTEAFLYRFKWLSRDAAQAHAQYRRSSAASSNGPHPQANSVVQAAGS